MGNDRIYCGQCRSCGPPTEHTRLTAQVTPTERCGRTSGTAPALAGELALVAAAVPADVLPDAVEAAVAEVAHVGAAVRAHERALGVSEPPEGEGRVARCPRGIRSAQG